MKKIKQTLVNPTFDFERVRKTSNVQIQGLQQSLSIFVPSYDPPANKRLE